MKDNAGYWRQLFWTSGTGLCALAIAVVSLYFGSGGLLVNKHRDTDASRSKSPSSEYPYPGEDGTYFFKTADDAYKFGEFNEVLKLYPWIEAVQLDYLILLVSGTAMGMLGGLIRWLWTGMRGNVQVSQGVFRMTLLGALMGVVMFGTMHLAPIVFLDNSTESLQVTPISLIFLCLFAGIYSLEILDNLGVRIFKFTDQRNEDKNE